MHTVLTLQTIDATSMIKKSALQIHQSKTQSLHAETVDDSQFHMENCYNHP